MTPDYASVPIWILIYARVPGMDYTYFAKLRSFGASMFYNSFIESLLNFSFLSLYGSLSVRNLSKLRRIVPLCQKIIGTQRRSLDTIFSTRTLPWCRKSLLDDCPIFAQYFFEMPSERLFKVPLVKTQFFDQASFLQSVIIWTL